MSKSSDNPLHYIGPRTPIITKHPCGFCNAKECNKCVHEIPYFEKLWICPCTCNKSWVPKDLGTVSKEKTKRKEKKNDEGRTSGEPSDGGNDAGGGEPMASSETPDEVSDESSSD